MTVIAQTTTSSSWSEDRKLIKSEECCDNGVSYTLSTYEIPDYGQATFASIGGRTDGEFRRVRAMIPFEFMDKRAKDFNWSIYKGDVSAQKEIANKFIVNFGEFSNAGKGLYIYSEKKGSGKTFLASVLLNELIETKSMTSKFINTLDLIELTKKGFRYESCNDDVDAIFKSKVLVLDDIGVQLKKEWVDTVLYRLINYRSVNKLVTIFTSNVKVDGLDIDDRIIDRIGKMTIPLVMPEESIRRRLAEDENQEFLKNILRN